MYVSRLKTLIKVDNFRQLGGVDRIKDSLDVTAILQRSELDGV